LPGDTYSLFGVCAHFVSALFVIGDSAFASRPTVTHTYTPFAFVIRTFAFRFLPLVLQFTVDDSRI